MNVDKKLKNFYGFDHHSPSQITTPDDIWGYKYLYMTPEQRAKLKPNSKMVSGTVAGEAIGLMHADIIYKRDGKTKFIKRKNKKIYFKSAAESAVTALKKYEPQTLEDKESHIWNMKGFLLMLENLNQAVKACALKNGIESEKFIEWEIPGCKYPMHMHLDLNDPTKLIEIKTRYRKRGRSVNSDGITNHSIQRCLPYPDHILQVILYYLATNLEPKLIVVNEEEFKIFDRDNSEYFTTQNIKKIFQQVQRTCIRRERLIERHQGKDTWVQDVNLDLKHFKWDGELKNEAEELWNQNL